MNLTVETAVSPRRVDEENIEYWANYEVQPALAELRSFANARGHSKPDPVTTAALGVMTTIFTTEDMPASSVWAVDAHIVARATAGGAARARYHIAGLFYREAGGAVTQEGATVALVTIESVAAFAVQFSILGTAVRVQAQDDGVRTVNWSVVVTIGEAL